MATEDDELKPYVDHTRIGRGVFERIEDPEKGQRVPYEIRHEMKRRHIEWEKSIHHLPLDGPLGTLDEPLWQGGPTLRTLQRERSETLQRAMDEEFRACDRGHVKCDGHFVEAAQIVVTEPRLCTICHQPVRDSYCRCTT